MENPSNHAVYYLAGPEGTLHCRDGPESTLVPTPWKAFVSERLMLIPEDTEFPPDCVQEW